MLSYNTTDNGCVSEALKVRSAQAHKVWVEKLLQMNGPLGLRTEHNSKFTQQMMHKIWKTRAQLSEKQQGTIREWGFGMPIRTTWPAKEKDSENSLIVVGRTIWVNNKRTPKKRGQLRGVAEKQ